MASGYRKKGEQYKKDFLSVLPMHPRYFDNTEDYEKHLLEVEKKQRIYNIESIKRNPNRMSIYDTMYFLSIFDDLNNKDDIYYFGKIIRTVERYFKFILLLKTKSHKAAVSSRLKGLTSKVVKLLKKTDTPPTTITLSTLRTSAAIFRRVGICA